MISDWLEQTGVRANWMCEDVDDAGVTSCDGDDDVEDERCRQLSAIDIDTASCVLLYAYKQWTVGAGMTELKAEPMLVKMPAWLVN